MAKLRITTQNLNGKAYSYRPKYVPKDVAPEEVNRYLKDAAKEAAQTNSDFLNIKEAVLVETVKRVVDPIPEPAMPEPAPTPPTPDPAPKPEPKERKSATPKELRNPATFGWLITPPEMEKMDPEEVAEIMVNYLNIDTEDPERIKYFLKTYAQMHHQYHAQFLRVPKEIATDILKDTIVTIYKSTEWTWEMICYAKKMRKFYSFKEWVALNGRLKKQREVDSVKNPDHLQANKEIEAVTVQSLTIYKTEINIPTPAEAGYHGAAAEPLM